MNYENVHQLFMMMSDEPDWRPYNALINLAIGEVEKMIPTLYTGIDIRMDYLIASLANYRFQLMRAGQNDSQYTYAGKMDTNKRNTAVANAERFFLNCLELCSDIVPAGEFAFISFSGGEEKIK